ncbi:hypothetical protein ACHHYP_02627 [Achlya hypogyna]|uniref:Uncharacterized protein n=1 Tax=Achlya hypogyna TaxID=1202772 RepID=A0A1V9Z5P9_ACHHY|nr:hypothetical protein ACHHYP_02627 [Achlya hypogyna]
MVKVRPAAGPSAVTVVLPGPAAALRTAASTRADVMGLAYVLVSLTLGLYSLALLSPYLSSDFFWVDFATADVSTALATVYNSELSVAAGASPLDLLAVGVSGTDIGGVLKTYPRRLMYEELTSLNAAITGLRNLDTAKVVTMIAQYCWVDLDRRWAMAINAARQVRCRDLYRANGAVYLEAVLRNIDFAAWVASTQGHFEERIAAGVAQFADGRAFLAYLAAHQRIDVALEVDFWQRHGLGTFVLQYANAYQIGLEEDIQIENALGATSLVRIKTIRSTNRGTLWTTDYMYAGFAAGLSIPFANLSLVQNASNFFGLLDTDLLEHVFVCTPLSPAFQAVHDQIGPLAAIDVLWVPVPTALATTVREFRVMLRSAPEAAINAIGTAVLHPTPMVWRNASLLFYGGNPTCGFLTGFPFIQESFDFDDACAEPIPLTMRWTPFSGLFAAVMGAAVNDTSCDLVPSAEAKVCVAALAATRAAVSYVPALTSLRTVSIDLTLVLLQFVSANGTLTIETQDLLDPTFAAFGWTALYEWAMNVREVVSFQGSTGSYVVMSAPSTLQALPPFEVSSHFAVYIWYCCAVVSTALTGVAVVLFALWLAHRHPGSPWFYFNRIVSATWLNRSLLLVRGLGAVLCLASATPIPETTSAGLRFTTAPRSFVVSAILAGEATWVAYVLHEFLVPITTYRTATYAPVSALLSWLVLFGIDHGAPVLATASIDRTCFTRNMDQMIYCLSGTVRIGDWSRTLLLLGVQLASMAVALAVCVLVSAPSGEANAARPSLLLSSAATAFLAPDQLRSATMNVVSAAMCGILHVPRHGLFDLKLWLPLSTQDGFGLRLHDVSLAPSWCTTATTDGRAKAASPRKLAVQRQVGYVTILGGLTYIVASLTSNVVFLGVARQFLANDFGWSGFNSTGVHAFVANTLNRRLLLSTSQDVDLSALEIADADVLYNGTVTVIESSAGAARRQLMVATIDDAIRGLRDMDPCMLPWMATQYCWLDLNRTWALASTMARQERCSQTTDNGALYLEAPLRNCRDWGAWDFCWGAAFASGVGNYLRTSTTGRAWLAAVRTNYLSVAAEGEHWRHRGLRRFNLQWQNYKAIGLIDVFTITSALGYESPLTLTRIPATTHIHQQTSLRMYWTFASDLWAIATNATLVGGRSLVASSPAFAFVNVSSAQLLAQNLTLPLPLTPGLAVLESVVGPFGAVDLHYVPCPSAAIAFYDAYTRALNALLLSDAAAQAAYYSFSARSRMCAVPPELGSNATLMANGGNLMCGNDLPVEPAYYGLLSGFGAENVCHALFLETIVPSTRQLIFAVVGHGTTDGDTGGICAVDACAGASCAADYDAIVAFVAAFAPAFTGLNAASAFTAVRATGVQAIQYYTATTDAATQLYRIDLLTPLEPAWSFFGWCYVFEWVVGAREVVSFQGDVGVVTAMSVYTTPMRASPNAVEIPVSFSSAVLGCTVYITWLLISVAGLVGLYAIRHKGRLEGANLFEINRIAGHVWAGRTFLCVRSITAIWILNTAPLELDLVGRVTRLMSPPRPWYDTILAASEATWLVYALNDLLSCITQQYTTYYAFKSSLSTWCIVVLWSFLVPLSYSAQLRRTCSYVDMDAALTCVSGTIDIGCIAFWYAVERVLSPRLPPTSVHSLLLSAHSLYMLDFRDWCVGGEYFLDKTSAVMAGLLSVEYNDCLYILDIKTWRVFMTSIPHEFAATHPCYHWSIPLSRI